MKRIALLSNVTAELLAARLKKQFEVYAPAGFDVWQREIYDPGSGLYAYRPEAVILLLYAEPYIEDIEERTGEWLAAVEHIAEQLPGVPVLVSSLDIWGPACRYGAEGDPAAALESRFTQRLEALYREGRRVYVLPVKELVLEQGRRSFYSAKMWYMGSMPYTMKAINALAELIERYCAAAKGSAKKCLAVDLDNTLWGGVIGEDGIEGIQLSGHKEGARYKDTQRLLQKMRRQGVMLAILSKNNPEDVEAAFRHPDMVLSHEDFVAEAVNWDSKPVNLRRLAAELNIASDAFVFLDDNPAEREQMRAACPEVAVPDFPEDTALLPETVAKIYDEYFLGLDVTGEDANKTAMYRSEVRRKAEQVSAVSAEDYLKKLQMELDLHEMEPAEEKRVVQLVNKTNQFNLTTMRYGEEEIHRLATAADSQVLTMHMADKYGEQGLVAVLILKYASREAELDTFLMSCRVMGREAEREIMAWLCRYLAVRGVKTLRGRYSKTAKNAPVELLYEKLGFRLEATAGQPGELGFEKRYSANPVELTEPSGVFYKVRAFGEEQI